MRYAHLLWAVTAASALSNCARAVQHNVILFVADGMRPGMVDDRNTPTLANFLRQGVRFSNTHSMFPTFTTANASAMASGHKLGDTGDFSNVIDAGFKVPGAGDSPTPFLENDPVLGDVDEHFSGNYLNQDTVMKAARTAGMSTATIGKLGPALTFDHTERSGSHTVVIDDMTGRAGGIPLASDITARLQAAGLGVQAPTRGDDATAGDAQHRGTTKPNAGQQDYFLDVATKVVLPGLKERGRPFMMVFWSRDPYGTQHNQGDSLNRLVPGINGPTSLAAIANADHDLAGLLSALQGLGLDPTTDVIVTSDRGFSTISKESATSFAAAQAYKDVVPGTLPSGFVAIDLAHGLELPLLDPDAKYAGVSDGTHSSCGNGLIGGDKANPPVVVAANGGSDFVYLPGGSKDLARRVVDLLAAQDYVSELFVYDDLGPIPGTLPISSVDLKGSAVTPLPAIVVDLQTFSTGCQNPLTCGVKVGDTGLQQGQGIHSSSSRAETANLGGALGPDFKTGFVDPAPTSNADVGKTMACILRHEIKDVGKLVGRPLTEAMPNGTMPTWSTGTQASEPDGAGRKTVATTQSVGDVRYFDAAGYPGRMLGIPADVEAQVR